MKNCLILAHVLRAAFTCAAHKDVRYYLNAVYVEPAGGRVTATDGPMLFCGQIDRADFPSILVPRDVLETVFKALGPKGIRRTNIELVEEEGRFKLVTMTGSFPFTPVDGKFPEYERIIPPETSGKVGQFDPALINRGREALMWYSLQEKRLGYYLSHNGDFSALYSEAGTNAFCVIMPMRATGPSDLGWFRAKPAVKAKKKAA